MSKTEKKNENYLNKQRVYDLADHYQRRGLSANPCSQPYGYDIDIGFQPVYDGILIDREECFTLTGRNADSLLRDANNYLEAFTLDVEKARNSGNKKAYEYAYGCAEIAELILQVTEEWVEANG